MTFVGPPHGHKTSGEVNPGTLGTRLPSQKGDNQNQVRARFPKVSCSGSTCSCSQLCHDNQCLSVRAASASMQVASARGGCVAVWWLRQSLWQSAVQSRPRWLGVCWEGEGHYGRGLHALTPRLRTLLLRALYYAVPELAHGHQSNGDRRSSRDSQAQVFQFVPRRARFVGRSKHDPHKRESNPKGCAGLCARQSRNRPGDTVDVLV